MELIGGAAADVREILLGKGQLDFHKSPLVKFPHQLLIVQLGDAGRAFPVEIIVFAVKAVHAHPLLKVKSGWVGGKKVHIRVLLPERPPEIGNRNCCFHW